MPWKNVFWSKGLVANKRAKALCPSPEEVTFSIITENISHLPDIMNKVTIKCLGRHDETLNTIK